MNIIIREVQEADLPQVFELVRELATFQESSHLVANTLEQMREEQHAFTAFVAVTHGGEIVGCVFCFFAYYTWTGKSLYMDDLYVRPGFRGKGIGTKLMNKVIDLAHQTRCRKIRWQVSKWNERAIDFYKKIGAEINQTEMNCDLPLPVIW